MSRRAVVKSSIFGLLAVSIPGVAFTGTIGKDHDEPKIKGDVSLRYPAIEDEVVSEVVGKSHFDLDRVKELVEPRPELARATWDWGFGDWETAIGAASHVGRRDIIEYLMLKGARPNLFTFAALGNFEVVKAIIEANPGAQRILGPHGISLLQHSKSGLRQEDLLSSKNKKDLKSLIDYLEKLGDADGPTFLNISDSEKEAYLGDYMYGEGEKDGFSIRLNMSDLLSLGVIGSFGGALYKVSENLFVYNKAPSVKISFQKENEKVVSMTINEPNLTIIAKRIESI